MSPCSKRFVASVSSASFSLTASRVSVRAASFREAVLPLPVAGFAVEFGQAHRRHGVAVRVGRLSAVDFREDPFGLLQSPVGLQLEGFLLEIHFGVFGQQRHDRVAQRPDLGGVIRAERLVAGVARQVFVVADAGPAVGELLVRGQRPEVDGAEQVGSLHEQPREGIDEGQPQAAFGPQPLVAQRFGDAEVVVDVTRGRVADERGVVVDDLVVDPVAVPERLAARPAAVSARGAAPPCGPCGDSVPRWRGRASGAANPVRSRRGPPGSATAAR